MIFVGLVCLVASMPLSIAAMNISLFICLLLSLWDRAGGSGLGWKRTPIDEPLMALIALTILSSLFGIHPAKSILRLGAIWIFLVYYFYFWYSSSEKKMRRLVYILCGVASLVSVLAVLQHFTGLVLLGRTPEPTTGFSAISLLDSSIGPATPVTGGGTRYIAKGTFSHHQTFANIYLMIFCMAFSLAVGARTAKSRLVLAASTTLLGLAVFFTYTRGIWLATPAAILIIAFFRSRRALVTVCVACLVIGLLLVVIPSTFSDRARTIFTLDSNLDRVAIWQTSWAMLRDHPILGIGPGNYTQLQKEYLPIMETGLKVSKAHAHNTYLQMAVERGFLTVVAFFWLWYVVLRIGFTSLWFLKGMEGFRLAAIRGAVAGVIGFLIDGLFQNNFGDTEVTVLLFFLVAIVVGLRVRQVERENLAVPGVVGNAPA